MSEEPELVPIFFADVTGSTALDEALDPEDVRALMARYFEHARRVVSEYGGTVEEFIGDAVTAVFGLAQAHGDDAERWLRCGRCAMKWRAIPYSTDASCCALVYTPARSLRPAAAHVATSW
jgi:class 3 adenylate cyclase